jgi:hypothetical protein
MDRHESFLAVLACLEQWLASQHIPYTVCRSASTAPAPATPPSGCPT